MPATTALVVLVVSLLMLVLPGLLTAAAFGLRGWLAAATAPLLTYGIVGAAGPVLPAIGILWSPAAFAAVSLAFSAVVAGARLGVRRVHRDRSAAPVVDRSPNHWAATHHAGIAAAVLLAAAVGFVVTVQATREFTAVPQVWDSVFHSNAIRYIADSGQSNPDALRNLNDPVVASYYYPNAFHVLAATVVMVTGADVPTVITTGVALFVPMLAVGAVALIRSCGGRPAFAFATAVLSCAFTAFPWDLLPWGTLLPFITALTLMAAFLAIAATILRREQYSIVLPIALGLGGIGLLALHPSVAVAVVICGVALVIQTWLQRRPSIRDLTAVVVTVAAAGLLGLPLLLASFGASSSADYDWPAVFSPADALGQLFFLSHDQRFPQYWLVLLVAVGLVSRRVIRPMIWLVVAGIFFGGLFVLAAAYEGEIVSLLTRAWWNDRWRFAALWSVAALFLAGAGAVEIHDGVLNLLSRSRFRPVAPGSRGHLVVSSAVLAVLFIGIWTVTGGLYQERNQTRLAAAFTDGPTVSTEERLAFEQLARLVPKGQLVMNDSYDGSALMWALDDVRPVFASPVIAPQELVTMATERRVLFDSFDQIDTMPAVQGAVKQLGIRYVIVCDGFIGPARGHAPGMQNIEAATSLRLVFENNDARIYEIGEPAAHNG
ncbi:DUF6541 family protein [Pseudonocardia sp. T1-2H]|uniref:DUF6541 family protein n=1 Tax=Pseudonocardia sp. T1-2H TaxID=3128899 RepID=UPI0031013D2E